MGSSKLIPCFVVLSCTAFALPNNLLLSQPMISCNFSLLPPSYQGRVNDQHLTASVKSQCAPKIAQSLRWDCTAHSRSWQSLPSPTGNDGPGALQGMADPFGCLGTAGSCSTCGQPELPDSSLQGCSAVSCFRVCMYNQDCPAAESSTCSSWTSLGWWFPSPSIHQEFWKTSLSLKSQQLLPVQCHLQSYSVCLQFMHPGHLWKHQRNVAVPKM